MTVAARPPLLHWPMLFLPFFVRCLALACIEEEFELDFPSWPWPEGGGQPAVQTGKQQKWRASWGPAAVITGPPAAWPKLAFRSSRSRYIGSLLVLVIGRRLVVVEKGARLTVSHE